MKPNKTSQAEFPVVFIERDMTNPDCVILVESHGILRKEIKDYFSTEKTYSELYSYLRDLDFFLSKTTTKKKETVLESWSQKK